MLNTDNAQAAYDELVADLALSGKPFEDSRYAYMKLQPTEVATWLRTVPDADFIDVCGLANDALQAHLVHLLETTGAEREAAKATFCEWLMHRAVMAASTRIAEAVAAYEPPCFLRAQAM